jgi:hypothetical protein
MCLTVGGTGSSAFCLQMIYLVLVQKGLATHVISNVM